MFRFSEVHEDVVCRIEFQRTLRIPDNREYTLPPGLGRLPVAHVDDHAIKIPEAWVAHGGVILLMSQAEAMWINFSGEYPMAVKVAVGKIDALTGGPWSNALSAKPQDYPVIPGQPWLDGFCVQRSLIRQFVAMPPGEGYTAEEQLTGEAQHGGLQIVVNTMKAAVYEEHMCRKRSDVMNVTYQHPLLSLNADMGLAAGGPMRQEIYKDKYGVD